MKERFYVENKCISLLDLLKREGFRKIPALLVQVDQSGVAFGKTSHKIYINRENIFQNIDLGI